MKILKEALSRKKDPDSLTVFDVMKKFRLPRKIKNELRRNLWLYPADENGNRVVAFPYKSQDEYNAVKEGIVKDIMYKENPKAKRKIYWEKLNKKIVLTDEELKHFVDKIFAVQFRATSYDTLIKAKNHPKAIAAYYNFVNAYYLSKTERSYNNICCLAVDKAKELLRK